MTTAYELGLNSRGEWISKRERNEQLVAAGFDLARDNTAVAEFTRGQREAADQKRSAMLAAMKARLGAEPYWVVTAEHCSGKSVGHPCIDGVYSDPTDGFVVIVAATDEEAAEIKAYRELEWIIEESTPCKCRRHEHAGGNSWWSSVALDARQISAEQLGEYHPSQIID